MPRGKKRQVEDDVVIEREDSTPKVLRVNPESSDSENDEIPRLIDSDSDDNIYADEFDQEAIDDDMAVQEVSLGFSIGKRIARKKDRNRGARHHEFKMLTTWNFKGGVGKTTTLFAKGYALAARGKRVLFMDFDPQMNLTELCLSYHMRRQAQAVGEIAPDFFDYLKSLDVPNVSQVLSNALYNPRNLPAIVPADILQIDMQSPGTPDIQQSNSHKAKVEVIHDRLFLIPGCQTLGRLDHDLSNAFGVQVEPVDRDIGSQTSLVSYPARIYELIQKTARAHSIDYVLIDLNPSIGALNECMLMLCHTFTIPCEVCSFSNRAVETLGSLIPEMKARYDVFRNALTQRGIGPALPTHDVKFGGFLLLGYDYGSDYAFKKRADEARAAKIGLSMNRFVARLSESFVSLDSHLRVDSLLSRIPEYHTLGKLSQNNSVPVPYLSNIHLTEVYRTPGGKRSWKKISSFKSAKKTRQHHRVLIESVIDCLLQSEGIVLPSPQEV
jgi:chromosome partitioning protein